MLKNEQFIVIAGTVFATLAVVSIVEDVKRKRIEKKRIKLLDQLREDTFCLLDCLDTNNPQYDENKNFWNIVKPTP